MISQISILHLKLSRIFRYNHPHVDEPEPVPSNAARKSFQVWLGSLLCAQTAPRLGEPFFFVCWTMDGGPWTVAD